MGGVAIVKISDCLLTLIHIASGIEPYKISGYCSELVKLGYVKVTDDLKFILTEKGEEHVKKFISNINE